MAPRRTLSIIFPVLDAVPHIEASGKVSNIKFGIGLEQGRHHRLRPWPIGAGEIGCKLCSFTGCGVVFVGEPCQELICHEAQGGDVIVQGIKRK